VVDAGDLDHEWLLFAATIPQRKDTREWVSLGFAESQEAHQNAEVGYVGRTGAVYSPWLVAT
jgi:hypothetical protein